MKLSQHLTLQEFIDSNTAKIRQIDNRLPDHLLSNATNTAKLFETVRHILGDKPIRVSSGYRCAELNKAVRGVSTSQHTQALAIDIVPLDKSVSEAFFILSNQPETVLVYDQLIYETDKSGHAWIHISQIPDKKSNRQQIIPHLIKNN